MEKQFDTILIMDDGQAFQNSLENKGISTLSVPADGFAGLNAIRNLNPLVAVIDLSLRGMDGLQLLKAVANLDACTTMVVCCDDVDERVIEEARRLGAVEIFTRPISPHNLAEIVSVIAREMTQIAADDNILEVTIDDIFSSDTDSDILRKVIELALKASGSFHPNKPKKPRKK